MIKGARGKMIPVKKVVTSTYVIFVDGTTKEIFRQEKSLSEVESCLYNGNVLPKEIRIRDLFEGNEELRSKELIRRIKEEFGCGDKAAYKKIEGVKGTRRGRGVFYVKADFVDSAPNGEEAAVEGEDEEGYQELDKILESYGYDVGGEEDLPGRDKLEEMFDL
ncbi:MAG: hypothetical protein WC175_01800 [Candidatus Dojkabacteria bacterium]